MSAILTETRSASEAIGRLDRFAIATGTDRMATVQIVMVEPGTGKMTVASAGHPPPVVAGGEQTSLVEIEPCPPIGSHLGARDCPEVSLVLGGGPVLLYTDGLVEHRHQDLTSGLGELVKVVGTAPALDPGALCDHVIDSMLDRDRQRDDVALLAARLRPSSS